MLMENYNILVIIPARGGSKGIPRKNLRALADKPLIFYSIQNALNSRSLPDVYVSSDDDEILSVSQKLGAKTIKRNNIDARDVTTLDPVIYNAHKEICLIEKKNYDLVVTLQPTSPLLKTDSLDAAIFNMYSNRAIDTVISAVNDTHLTWSLKGDKFLPNYEERVNRQQLKPVYKETGGFMITRPDVVTQKNRIGKNVDLHILTEYESIDIDTYADWGLCEYYLKRKRVLFVVSGYYEIGLGHVYNTLLIANDILEHEVIFLVDNKSQLALEKIASKNYQVFMQKEESITDDIEVLKPDVIINDRLDTEREYITRLKGLGYKVINFEDLGGGAGLADLTINAIYPEREVIPNHYFGYKYFILRDEFILSDKYIINSNVNRVLISFGGVDPNNYTCKVLSSIYKEATARNIQIDVILGFGYGQEETLKQYNNIIIYRDVQNISDHMKRADVIFSSAGRTTYEIASLNVPAIILAQNNRELTHLFANAERGFINLGLGTDISKEEILLTFLDLTENLDRRKYMSQLMAKCDLVSGRRRVVSLIKRVINS